MAQRLYFLPKIEYCVHTAGTETQKIIRRVEQSRWAQGRVEWTGPDLSRWSKPEQSCLAEEGTSPMACVPQGHRGAEHAAS